MNLYDRVGQPQAYIHSNGTIFSFGGRPLGYLHGDRVYTHSGRFLGWFEDGWLFDGGNRPALFAEAAIAGPFRPFRAFAPFKGFRQFEPFKGFRQVAPFRPFKSSAWSERSGIKYFD